MNELAEVPFRPSRQHHFTSAQKWALLLEWDQCLDRGSKAEFCRRIGVWNGTPLEWSRQRADGRLQDPATVGSMNKDPKKDSRLSAEERRELQQLRRENQRLERELEQSQAAVDILGKAAALLESLAKSADQLPPEPKPGRPAWLQGPDTSQLPPIPPRPSKPRE